MKLDYPIQVLQVFLSTIYTGIVFIALSLRTAFYTCSAPDKVSERFHQGQFPKFTHYVQSEATGSPTGIFPVSETKEFGDRELSRKHRKRSR